ncbi:MAG TPA: rhodanese-like domain-containing protein [Cryomorphaceae bacterium]|nr:rhodanese-like domain-containing protein [Cryomorphaceae bacterium]
MKYLSTIIILIAFMAPVKSQNKMGFDLMIKTLISGDIDTLNGEAVASMLNSGEDVVLLDAREKQEFEVSHIPNSRFVGHESFEIESLSGISKSDTIVVYCSVGKRSEDVARKIAEAGYTNVYNYFGGIFDWTNRGFPVVNIHNEKTSCVHPYSKVWGIWVNNLDKCYEPR